MGACGRGLDKSTPQALVECSRYVQTGRANSMCKLYVQTGHVNSMCKLVVQTAMCKLLCENWSCKLPGVCGRVWGHVAGCGGMW